MREATRMHTIVGAETAAHCNGGGARLRPSYKAHNGGNIVVTVAEIKCDFVPLEICK